MFILTYTNDYRQQEVKTRTFDTADRVVSFIAENSSNSNESRNFATQRIDEYDFGVVKPQTIKFEGGRLRLKQIIEEAK